MALRGCPLAQEPTQGAVWAAHGPTGQYGGSAWRYWGVYLTRGITQREYWGIAWPLKQTRGTASS